MSIKPDHWIRRMAQEEGMIEPYVDQQKRAGVVSYGLSSYGYDIRVADDFMIFTNVNSAIVDPKDFDPKSFVKFKGDVCLIPPNSFALARSVEYIRMPNNVLAIVMGKSTYARCFRGDTRVALVDGTAPTLEQMAKRYENGEKFWGYSIDRQGRVIVTLLDQPRYIGRDALLEVILDNGQSIYCTPDHKFLLRSGGLEEAINLRPGTSLMSLYRHVYRGYEMVYQPLIRQPYPTHHLANEWNIRNGIYQDHPSTVPAQYFGLRRAGMPVWTGLPQVSQLCFPQAVPEGRFSRWASWLFRNSRGTPKPQRQHTYPFPIKNTPKSPLKRGVPASSPLLRGDLGVCRAFSTQIPEEPASFASQKIPSTDRYHLDHNKPNNAPYNYDHLDATEHIGHHNLDKLVNEKKNHKVVAINELPGDHDVYCLTVPEAGNFALEVGVFVRNCGIITNFTPLEPAWEGHITIEISNTTPLPAKIYANEGIAQVIFFESDEACEVSYADKKGKYQGQLGITLPKL